MKGGMAAAVAIRLRPQLICGPIARLTASGAWAGARAIPPRNVARGPGVIGPLLGKIAPLTRLLQTANANITTINRPLTVLKKSYRCATKCHARPLPHRAAARLMLSSPVSSADWSNCAGGEGARSPFHHTELAVSALSAARNGRQWIVLTATAAQT